MSLDGLYTEYPGLNPAVWRPLISLGDDEREPVEVESPLRAIEVESQPAKEGLADAHAPRRKSDFQLPHARELGDGNIDFPEQLRAGANSIQLKKAAAMHLFGLCSKARRQASCGVFARISSCENGHQHYHRYGCKNRYCPEGSCGRRAFLDLFNKYMGLNPVAQRMVPDWENRPHRKPRSGDFVIAKIDITIRSDDRMPSNAEVRRFNSDVRTLFRAAEKEFGLTYPKRIKVDGHLVAGRDPRPGDYGVIWTDEFGGKATRRGKVGNTNLHAHAVYCGPYIPQRWISGQWAEIRADGSKIVSIKIARTFRAGLYHALKYAGKILSTESDSPGGVGIGF